MEMPDSLEVLCPTWSFWPWRNFSFEPTFVWNAFLRFTFSDFYLIWHGDIRPIYIRQPCLFTILCWFSWCKHWQTKINQFKIFTRALIFPVLVQIVIYKFSFVFKYVRKWPFLSWPILMERDIMAESDTLIQVKHPFYLFASVEIICQKITWCVRLKFEYKKSKTNKNSPTNKD